MTRRTRILRNVAVGLVSVVLVGLVVAVQVIQTDWFRNYVRLKIVSATEESVGGRVEVGSFTFDWRHLHAQVTNFVIHGTEPTGADPFFRAARVDVYLRLFSSTSRIVDVSAILVEKPLANIMTLGDGSLNIPRPRKQSTSSTTPLETVVDLAIARFDLKSGTIRYNDATEPLDVRGENLRVLLDYNSLTRGYRGQVSMQPLYILRGRVTPVVFTLNVPVVLERDQISVKDATIVTPSSELKITATLENLRQPHTTVQAHGSISIQDVNSLGSLSLASSPHAPAILIDAAARFEADSIAVQQLHMALGGSKIDASGMAKDITGRTSLAFTSTLNLQELARLTKSQQKVGGNVDVAGITKFDGKLLAFENLSVRGFGGELTGEANIQDFARYHAEGKLSGVNLRGLEERLGLTPLPYEGTISGDLRADGDLHAKNSGLKASVNLRIAPGRRGIPIAGRIEAGYDAGDGILSASDSYVTLPHSKLNFAGSLQNGFKIELTSRDLGDLFAAIPGAAPPVKLNTGKLEVVATVGGTLSDPRITGHALTTGIVVEDRQFDSIATDFVAAKSGVGLENGALARGVMQGTFRGTIGLRDWEPKPDRPLALTAQIRNGDLADVLALAAQRTDGYSGALTASGSVGGTIGNPTGYANVAISNGTLATEPFDDLGVQVSLADRNVNLSSGYVTRGQSRLTLTANFQHPSDSFTTGHIEAHVSSNPVELAGIKRVQSMRPGSGGLLRLDATVAGDIGTVRRNNIDAKEFSLKSVAGDLAVKGVKLDGQDYGDIAVKASTAGDMISYNLTSNFAGSQIHASGRTQIATDYPMTLDANLANLPVERALAAAKQTAIPAQGVASGTLHLSGTLADPQGNGDIELRRAILYDEPVDRLRLQVTVQPTSIDVTQFEATAGPSRLALSGRFDHPRGSFETGPLTFQVKNSRLDLNRIRNAQMRRPGLAGSLEIEGGGKGSLRAGTGMERFSIADLDARITASGLKMTNKDLGCVALTVKGTGDQAHFTLDSNLASAAIKGQGSATLRGDFPLKANLTFDNLSWANLEPFITGDTTPAIDAIASGSVSVDGPAGNLDQLNGSLKITKFQAQATNPQVFSNRANPFLLQNQGDMLITLQKGLVRVESAHIAGQGTDINLSGTGSARGETLNFRLNAKADLALVKALSTDVYSSGSVIVSATVQGSYQKPVVNGRLELHDASVASGELPVGLSKGNGTILFNGTTATIQTLTGEAGGGKLTLSGFLTRGDTLRFALRANAAGVRIRVQQGVSIAATADIRLTGSTDASLASGSVTIDRLTYLPQTDIAAMLSRSGPAVQTSDNPSPLLRNMALDIAVRTSAVTSIQSSLTQNLQVTSDLRVRGRASQPGITGSIRLDQGQVAFFGSTYQLSSGTISFYNPNRIAPQLDIALKTQAKGVTVVLSVTGPVDNLKLTYTSDPPLQFEEIVALLASGKTPTSDPTLLANQPSEPPQTFEQRGESALVGKALADPVTSRLQRVFGVSQLKIDPTFTSGSQLPQARVTLQQQVASNLLFTYVTALDNPNTQIIRIEWSLSPQWSAAANRDENGIFSINLLYKKQFH